MADKVTNLYNTFKKNGYAMESEAEFRKNLQDPKKRRAAYDALVNDGYDMEAYDQFESNIGFAKPATPAQNATPQDDARTILTTETQQVVPATEQGVQSTAPAQSTWQPTEQEKIRMSYELNQMVQSSQERMKEGVESFKRMGDHFTPDGRKRLELAKFQAQLAGTPTSVMGLNPPARISAAEVEQADSDEQQKPVKSLQSPVPYGVKVVNGKRETEWLLPDGRTTTDILEADVAEYAARSNRLEHVQERRSVGGRIQQAMKELEMLKRQLDDSASRVQGEWTEEYKRNSAPLAAVLAADTYVPRQQADMENRALRVAIRQKEEQIKNLQEQRDREAGKDVGFWRGFGRVAGDIRTWDFGHGDLSDAMTMMGADYYSSEKATRGEKLAGQAMMKSIADRQETEAVYGDKSTWWNRAGLMAGHMPSFMLDFMLTGGGFEAMSIGTKASTKGAAKLIGREAVEEIAKSGVKQYAKKHGMRGVGQMAGNWTIKALGSTVDDLLIRAPFMANTVQGAKTASDVIGRKLGDVTVDEDGNYDFANDKTWGSAIWQGEANAIIENYSEMFGAHLDGATSALAKTFGGKRIGGMLARANLSGYGRILSTTRKQFEKLGLSDFLGEVSEEYYGQLWRTMLNLDDAYKQNADGSRTNLLMTGQFHGDIWGGMALSMGLMGAGKHTISAAEYHSMKHKVNLADQKASHVFGQEPWEAIKESIDNTTNDDIGSYAEQVLHDEQLSQSERDAIMNYMERSLNFRGYNLGTMAKMRGNQAVPAEEAEAEDVYESGRELFEAQEEGTPEQQAEARADMDAIALQYREALEGFEDVFGAEAEARMAEMQENQWDLLINPELTADQQDAVLDYIKSRAALDGVQDAADESADRKREAVTKAVADRTHKDAGVVIPATMKVDDRQVYIVKGNVMMFEDGTGVDVRNSDKSVVVLDPQKGEIEITSPDQIFKVGEAVDPQTELDNALAEVEAGRNIFPNAETEPDTESENIPVVNVEEYDKGYGDAIEEAQNLSDERLDHYVDVLREGAQKQMQENGRVDDYIRGRLEALEFVQQDRSGIAVPKTEETVPNPTENAVSDAENVPETFPSVENGQQTALSRIPIDPATQEPIFEAAPDRDTAWDGLVEAVGNEDGAAEIAAAQVQQASTDLEVLSKKQPAKKAPKLKGSPMAMAKAQREAEERYQKEMADYNQQVAETQSRLDAWNGIVGVYNSRNAELRRQQVVERQARQTAEHDAAVARFEEEQRIKAEKEAEQAAVGTHAVNPKIKARWDAAPKTKGNPDVITLPDGSTIRGCYVLTEAGAASTSHDVGNAYMPTEGFPIDENGQSVNDRDYQHDRDAQRIVEDMAGAYDNRALQTPVIVSKDGVVLSGNNRTMSGDLAARQGTDKAYVDYVREFGAKYGFTPEQVQGMKNPRIVFVPDDALPYDAATFSRFNAQEMKSQSKPEAAVKLGKIVPDEVFNGIVGDIARYDRLSDYYADEKAVAHALGALQQAGVINDKQMPEMRTGTALSAAGKELIENTLIGKVFQTSPDAVREIIALPTLRQSVVMGLNEIAGNRTLAKSGYGLSDELSKAVDLVFRAKAAMPDVYVEGVPVSPFGRQQGLFDDEFGDSRVTDGVTLLLADMLNSGKPSDLRKMLTTYNAEAMSSASGQLDMFSGAIPTKEEILTTINEHFRNATPREQQALVDAAIAERKRRAEAERGQGAAGEQTADAIQRSTEPQQPSAETEPDLTPEEQAISARVEVSEDDWTEGDENRPTYKRTIIIDGKHNAMQVDEPDADGHYTGSYFEYEGKRFGDIAEIVNYIDAPDAEPTEAQKKAGNYKMEHRRINGHEISIENPKGSVRRGKDANGSEWESEMHNDYGYIRGTEGVDGDHIDVFLSDAPEQGDVFVVDQYNPDGSFDEHKVMYGFTDGKAALDAYLANYEQGWEQTRRLDVTGVSKDEFKKWIQSSKRKTKPFAEYNNVTPIDEVNMPTKLRWSNERAGNGEPFLIGEKGSVDLVQIPEEVFEKMGIAPAPFRLTPSMVTHVYERHRKELKLNTPEDAVEAILDVMNNFDHVRQGRENTFIFSIEGTRTGSARRAVTFVLEYDKGEWLGIKTVGYDRIPNLKELTTLWEKGEKKSSATGVAPANVSSAQSSQGDRTDGIASNQRVVNSYGKVNTLSSDKQESNAESSKGYAITPATYTNKKGKEAPMHRLEFGRELTKEEESAVKKFASEKQGEGRFAPARGWKDRENGGWLFRTEEDARKAGELIGNEEAVADAQPLSREDISEAVAPASKPKKAPTNRVSVEDLAESLHKNGEAKLSDHAEPIEPKPEVQITDEMEDIAKQMRDILGVDDSEVGGVHFRDPDELKPEQKRKLVMLGIDLTMRLFDQGKTDFPTVAKVMVGMVGEKIKPWIKAMYKNATIVPGYDDMQFTSDAEIDRFDIANFDKPSADVMKQAEMIVAERKAKEATSQAEKEVIETRNQKRKEHDKQAESDTAALGEKAEAVASKAESLAETSEDRDELNRAAEEIEDTLDEVNEQLALLGYYEADMDDSKFHESYGYMLTAEKKAVTDATNLAKQLVNDLGLDIKVTGATTPLGRKKVKKGTAVRANLAPAGGDITIALPLQEGRELRIYIGLDPVAERGTWKRGDNLAVNDGIMYRVENPNCSGMERYGHNRYADKDVTYARLLDLIKREAKNYLPKQEQSSAEFIKEMSERMERGESPYTVTPEVEEQLAKQRKAEDVADSYDDGGYSQRHEIKEREKNGFKVGEKVWYTRNDGKGKRELATIVDFGGGADVTLDTGMAPVMYEACEWSQIAKREPDIFDKAAEIAEAAKAKREQKKTAKKSVSLPKQSEVKPEQPIGDLFSGLFDEPNDNERQGDTNRGSQAVADGERTHTVGADGPRTDGGLRAGETRQNGGRGNSDAVRSEKERGTDGATPATGELGSVQPSERNRGRDAQPTDGGVSVSAGRVGRDGADRPRTERRGTDAGAEGVSEGAVAPGTGKGSRPASVKKQERKFTENFRYGEDGNEADNYTLSQRLEGNVAALETLADVLFGNGKPTEEQKDVMSRFRGWGQVDLTRYWDVNALIERSPYGSPLKRLGAVIKRLDPDGEKKLYEAIKRASLSAYFTPTPVARAQNTFLGLAGFRGGKLLDPSMGNGVFEGTLPKELQERTMITGVELDWLTGQLARVLYPDADVRITGFQNSGFAPNSFDVITSNVPFGDFGVNDPSWKNDKTPIKRSSQNRIHNYYAVKMLELTRPGGLLSMMTTSAVMDTPSNQNVRRHIAEQGEIIGAVRIPDNTFQGTGAVADIIFVRKWRDENDMAETRSNPDYQKIEAAFLDTSEMTVQGKDGNKVKVTTNGYYGLFPKNMIGEAVAGNQYRADAFGLTSKMTCDEIGREIEKAVKRIVGTRKGELFNPTKTTREVHEAVREAYKGDGDWVSNGNLMVQDGKTGTLQTSTNEYGEVTRTFIESPQHSKLKEKIADMGEVRKAMKMLVAAQINGADEKNIAILRKQLNTAYDNFVSKHGKLRDKNNSFILDDIDGYTLRALEVWKDGKFVGLSDIFTKNTIKPALKLYDAKTPQEAITSSLAEYGELRPAYMEKILGENWAEACGDMIFRDPDSEDGYVTRDEYLSGDVVSKLEKAEEAAKSDPTMERNVTALREVQPVPIPFSEISTRLGARWIPGEVYSDFVRKTYGLHVSLSRRRRWVDGNMVDDMKSGISYSPDTDTFHIEFDAKELGGEAEEWSTARKSAKEILQAALEDKTIVVYDTDKEGNKTINSEHTELANEKVSALRDRFETWLGENEERADMLAALYNRMFNSTVKRKFDGSHLNIPGLMGKELRPHQKDAVWMLINNRGGIVDHIVGAGKTLVMQSAIMEMRRMGIAKKPMIVALKSTVSQIAREFKEAFPSARVLAPGDGDFSKENRKRFMANISLNDYDCVILSHEQYCMLPHSEEAERVVIDEQLAQLNAMIEYLYGTDDKSQMTKKQIKALEKRKENLLAKLAKRLDRNVDREFCFENLGVDYLFVDECHQFKSLPYVTSYNKVAGLGDTQGSNRAVALLTGIRYLQKMHQGDKGTIFLSGTTITNSLVEIYNLMNYLRPRKMEELGFTTFDAWASTFAIHSAELEAGAKGTFEPKDRFRNFANVPELSQLYAEIADVRNDSNLKLPKPSVDGKYDIVPASEAIEEINREIVNMLDNKDGSYFGIHPKDPQKYPWGLTASGLSAKASISPRLIFPDMEDEGGKMHYVCENVKKAYDKMAEHKGVQLIFCELGVPSKGKKYDAYNDIIGRLTNTYGIPRSEIAYIQEAKNDEAKEELFQKARGGQIRILIGGTKNMGTGVNVQTRITDMHFMSVPWTPAALEQCIGRGARQGNWIAEAIMGNKVRVHYYATEGTLDLYKFQLLDAKGKMFTQFKTGTTSGSRDFDEGAADEDGNIDPAELVAILSGNPIIFEKAKQEKYVKKLKNLRNGFLGDYQRKKAKADELMSRKEKFERLIRINNSDVADLQREGFVPDDKGVYPSKVTVTDGGYYGRSMTFDKPKEAGEYILKQLKDGKKVYLQGFGVRAEIVSVNEEKAGLFAQHYEVQTGEGYNNIRYSVRLSEDATAAGTAFRSLLQRIINNKTVYGNEYESIVNRLNGMNVGDGIFPKQAELDEAVATLKQMTAEYNALGKKESDRDKTKFRDGVSDGEVDSGTLRAIERMPVEMREEVERYLQYWPSAPIEYIAGDADVDASALPLAAREGLRALMTDYDIQAAYCRYDGKIYIFAGRNGSSVVDRLAHENAHAVVHHLGDKGPEFVNAFARKVSALPDYDNALGRFMELLRSEYEEGEVDEEFLVYILQRAKKRPNLIAAVNSALDNEEQRYFEQIIEQIYGKERVEGDQATPLGGLQVQGGSQSERASGRSVENSGGVAVDKEHPQPQGSKYGHKGEAVGFNELRDRISTKLLARDMSARAIELSEKLNTPIRLVDMADEVMSNPSARHRRAKGWATDNGEIVIIVPNNVNVADIENTVVHEIVGHDGLEAMIGPERMDEFVTEVYDHAGQGIKKKIDARADKEYSDDIDRMTRQKGGGVFAKAEATVEANAKKRDGHYQREATKEYMADMAGEIGDKGFERMSQEELTLWGEIKAKVQQFLDKFLRGLKIAKSIRLTDKDLAYILYKAWRFKRENGVFAKAEDAVMRRKTGWDKRNPTWKETCYALTDSPQPHLKDAGLDSQTKSDTAKVQKISESLRNIISNMPKGGYGKNGFVYKLAESLGVAMPSSGKSNYVEVNIAGTGSTTIRISNHSATVSNFNSTENNVGIVIKASSNRFRPDRSVDYVEFTYFGDKVNGNDECQRAIVDGLRHYIETGSFEKMPEADRLNTSGRYRKAVDGLEDKVHFRDGGLGLEEAITKMKVEAAQANSDNLQAKNDAMKAIGGNIGHLRQAMARQREYDLTTVKSISDLAKTLLDAGLLDDLSKYETKRILGTIDNVVGKQDVSRYVQKVMDIMVDNQLRMGANALGRLLTIKGSRVDTRGIEVQGELDPEGVAIAKVVRKSISLPKDGIDNLIADAIDRMSSADMAIADDAALQYAGLQIARQYVESITESKAEEKLLRDSIKQAKADKDAGHMTDTAYRQYVSATEDAIRQNKIERTEAYYELVERVGGVMSESIERAKAWREAEKQRVEAIHHNANSDMEGRATDEHHKDDRVQKLANNSAVRFLLAPLGTFDQMLRMFGQKNVRGEGYLWNRYMRGWVDATEREYTGYRDALKRLDEKVSEVYGRNMKWGDLFTIDRKLPKANVCFWDGGEPKDHELTQGNLLYIYMADKMSDGRMKLRKMGITESDIEDIKNFLDPHFLELADWMQDEFLVEKRNEYNEVHKRMFGASMAAIENYFPLKILANARLEEVDVADDTTDTSLPATSTGSIIKRRRNNLALDVTGANAFSVILDHLQQMERWAAFAEFNRDLNTLLSYKRFRNQVMNMTSVYGGGKTLWNNFRNVCSMAAGAYRPPRALLDEYAVNFAKGVTVAKIAFRVFTALKQFASFPAYLVDSNPIDLAASIATPWRAWNWSMENLPLFEKRWTSRTAGDPRLMKTDMDWNMWRNNVVQLASRIGMSPNAFVDAMTVSIGAHAMYQTKKKKYLRWGMSEVDADKRAKQDATILFNQTQQSSESAFLSTMQADRSWLSIMFTIFRNASMSYQRRVQQAMRTLRNVLDEDYKGLSEEFMAKQMRRLGIDPDKADKEAKREFRMGIIGAMGAVAVFGYIMQLAWNMFSYLPYLLLGDDDEEKDKMWDDIFNHTYFGCVEGLTGGDVYSAAGQIWLNGEGDWSNLTKDMPIAEDLATIYRKMGKDNVAAMNDVVNLLAQSALGVNPQSLTDAVVAVMDACGDDADMSRECALLIARVINCPQSQLDKIYFDALGASGDEASRMTPQEIAERYARYKTRRNAPFTGWAYSDEEREKQMAKHRDESNTLAKERLRRQTDDQAAPNIGQWIEEYNATKKRVSEIRKLKDTDEDAYYDQLADLEQTPEYERYEIVKSYKHDIDEATKEWLRSATTEQRDSLVRAIVNLKKSMVEELNTQQ